MLLKLEQIIKLCVFAVIMTLNASVTTSYLESDLTISSSNGKFLVQFYNDDNYTIFCDLDGSKTMRGFYSTAVIYAKEPIDGLSFKQFNESTYYLCLHEEEKYQELTEALENFSQRTCLQPSASALSSRENGNGHTESSLDVLCQHIQSSESVCITFGTGISGGYVPTLVEFFNALGLEKSCAIDTATEESFVPFIISLATRKDEILPTVQTEWGKVFNCNISSTPAHSALKQLIGLLENKGMHTFAYTDNIDEIHHKVGIQLSEESAMKRIIYPSLDCIRDKKMTVLVCGQSFDFHCVLSTIHTRASLAREIVFFHLNLTPDRIEIFKGLDVDVLRESDTEIDVSEIPQETLEMQFISGNLHEILPTLNEKLR